LKDVEFAKSGHRLIVRSNVLKLFKKYGQGKKSIESGGILLGHVCKDHVEITKATTPNRFDSLGPRLFIRSKVGAQVEINTAWKRSNSIMIYLGEWHTHAEINPKPSITDKNTILKLLEKTKMEIDFLYLIIIGHDNTYWVGRQTEKELTELVRM